MKKRILTFLLFFLIITGNFTFAPKAQAILGLADIISDPLHTLETVANFIATKAQWVIDKALEVALGILKKRVLDAITDQTIQWIQGGGDPKFISNFGGFLKDQVSAATGDVIREVGLGALCQPFKLRLQFDLQKFGSPGPFSQQVTCSLDQVVGNFSDFYEDFSKGGWIGFNESLIPQNNYYGALILATEEVNSRVEATISASSQEISVGQGFLNTTKCYEWTPEGETGTRPVNAAFNFPDPNVKPPLEGDITDWRCTQSRITTPGGRIAETLSKAMGADIDYVANSNSLTNYIAAIADAAINRLVLEGVEGLQGMIASQTTTGGDLPSATIPGSVNTSGNSYTQTQTATANAAREGFARQITNELAGLTEASSTFGQNNNSNETLIAQLGLIDALPNCTTDPNYRTWVENLIIPANARTPIIASSLSEIGASLITLNAMRIQLSSPATAASLDTTLLSTIVGRSGILQAEANSMKTSVNEDLASAITKYFMCTI